ncbi:MAG TPA: LptA/OstA family protein [Vicinamibacterales bacterium]|nr:LptA/OstA family protein [Vicinamibacterales bacterium]
MTSWQRRARLGVLLFGATCAAIVYFGFRARQPLASHASIPPLEPRVVSEMTGGAQVGFSGLRKNYEVECPHIVNYDDGTTKCVGVTFKSTNREGREFVVVAAEGKTKDEKDYELSGGVILRDSSGFELVTDRCQFNKDTGIANAVGMVTFSKGRMQGTGEGMLYDQMGDVLRIFDKAHVDVNGETAKSTMRFTSGAATLDRMRDLLTLERAVHAVRGSEVTDADLATARLSADEDVVTFIELRGNSRVEGGAESLQSMRARDIDLDYTDDGRLLERAVLTSQGSVAMKGEHGAAGRTISAESIDVTLAPDGAVTRLLGDQKVTMSLPASAAAPARSVEADKLEATGAAGGSLKEARFTSNVGQVVFREAAAAGGQPRLARARALTLELAGDAVASALFTGAATFEEDDLKASAPEARYQPEAESLRLESSDSGGVPIVSDERLRVEAQAIDVGLEKRAIVAVGKVKTFLRPGNATPSRPGRDGTSAQPSRLPGLFSQNQDANVTAGRLDYDGGAGSARYSGSVWLWQGENEIRGDRIDLNQTTGDLLAVGSARSRLVFDTGTSEGRAHEIRYVDANRAITYAPEKAAAAAAPGAASHVRGPQGDLDARQIEVLLAKTESRVERIEADNAVTARLDDKTLEGHHLTYYGENERYRVTGTPQRRVSFRRESCKEVVGNALTYERSTDRMTIDGQDVGRGDTKDTCRQPASR